MTTETGMRLPVSEVFGPTFQGEGPHTGRRVGFVRLGYCNLDCSWCDTPYTWDNTRFDVHAEAPRTAITEVHQRLAAMGVDTVVLSGGEPMMWAHTESLGTLLSGPWEWHVETNGTKEPPAGWRHVVAHTTVSPKLANSGIPEARRLIPEALTAWAKATTTGQVIFKFVVSAPADLDEVAALADTYAIPARHIWIMPEGTSPVRIIKTHQGIAEAVLAAGYNTTTRLHTLLWHNQRAR